MAYVDTEKLKRNIRVNLMPNVDIDGTVTVENAERFFLDLIEKTPTADVAEVKHGRYITNDDGDSFCSMCGEMWLDATHNYYPNCGAKMDGVRENEYRK